MIYVWVALYGLTHTLSTHLSQAMPVALWIVPSAMLLYALMLVLWIYLSGRSRAVGLCMAAPLPAEKWLYLLSLFLIPGYNLLTVEGFAPTLSLSALMLSVAVTEEIFFRGFLLRFLTKHKGIPGFFLTNILFSMFHLVNLTQGADPFYTLTQVFCAFGAGLCYSVAAIGSGSLLPCIAAHFLTNITGSNQLVQSGPETAGLWMCIIVCICWGIMYSYKIRKFDKEIQS